MQLGSTHTPSLHLCLLKLLQSGRGPCGDLIILHAESVCRDTSVSLAGPDNVDQEWDSLLSACWQPECDHQGLCLVLKSLPSNFTRKRGHRSWRLHLLPPLSLPILSLPILSHSYKHYKLWKDSNFGLYPGSAIYRLLTLSESLIFPSLSSLSLKWE